MAAPTKPTLTPVENETSNFTNLVRSFLGQGTALGFGDEIEAYVRSKINDSKSYDELLTEIRADIDKFKDENPALAYGSEIAGSLIPGIGLAASATRLGAKGLTKIGAGVGGTEGAIYGAGVADEGERLSGAAIGGTDGALGGAAMSKIAPRISEGAKKLIKRGVDLTPGQATSGTAIGNVIKNVEEATSSVPLFGTQTALDSSRITFTKAVADEILEKINKKLPKDIDIDDVGDFLQKEVKKNIDESVKPLKIVNTKQLSKEFEDNIKFANLPEAEEKQILNVINKVITNRKVGTEITGKDLQLVDEFFRNKIFNYSKGSGKDVDIADAYSSMYKLFENNLAKNNSDELIKAYRSSKNAYGDLLTYSKAATSSTKDGAFGGKQLLSASRQADKSSGKLKFLSGTGRLQTLGKEGRDFVDSNTPDSGTVPRALSSFALLGGLGTIEPITAGATTAALAAYRNPLIRRGFRGGLGLLGSGMRGSVPYLASEASGLGNNALRNRGLL